MTSSPPSLRIFFPNLEHDPAAAPPLAREAAGTAPVVESPAVLRHVLGSIRKEKLMDTQTVIAVCELLLVVIGIVSLTRKDE